jgi:predicted XRE-type DNA-binding protein
LKIDETGISGDDTSSGGKHHMSEILNQVRQLIESSGESRYSIWKATGIPQGQLSRLMNGQSGLSLDSLERLLQHLGHEIKITKRRK